MKIATIRKLYSRLLKRRNKAEQAHLARPYDSLDHIKTRYESEADTLDKVLDDLDRLIARNHDRFHDRRKKKA